MMIKPWKFGAPNAPGQEYPFENMLNPRNNNFGITAEGVRNPGISPAGTGYDFVNPVVTYGPLATASSAAVTGIGSLMFSVLAQNSLFPFATFSNHRVVQVGNVLYDPSYGTKYADKAAFVSQAVAGFYKIDPNNPNVMLIRKPKPNLDGEVKIGP